MRRVQANRQIIQNLNKKAQLFYSDFWFETQVFKF